jgi:pyridoxal 5'-phosphate synthase pdxT subunit
LSIIEFIENICKYAQADKDFAIWLQTIVNAITMKFDFYCKSIKKTFMSIVGVLALQGAFSEHMNMLKKLGAIGIEVRTPEDLSNLDALILPGGESTTMALIAHRNGMIGPLKEFVQKGKPVWGTCAGMILLSNHADNTKKDGQELIGGLDIDVLRNAFGHQVDSFVQPLQISSMDEPFLGVFIRAPVIERVGPDVKVLCRIPERNDVIVACRQGHILATAFHPELTNDARFHQLFLEMI